MSALGDAVRDFAADHVTQRVGRGECTDLAVEALRSAGARTRFPAHNGNYVWGTPVALGAIEAGDILQFRSHHITIRNAGGDVQTEMRGHPTHTAIVIAVVGNGVFRIAEQNLRYPGSPRNVRSVAVNTIFLVSQRTQDRREITVRGQVWAYRPVAQ